MKTSTDLPCLCGKKGCAFALELIRSAVVAGYDIGFGTATGPLNGAAVNRYAALVRHCSQAVAPVSAPPVSGVASVTEPTAPTASDRDGGAL